MRYNQSRFVFKVLETFHSSAFSPVAGLFYGCTVHICKSQSPITTDSKQPCFQPRAEIKTSTYSVLIHSFIYSVSIEKSALAPLHSSIYHAEHPLSLSLSYSQTGLLLVLRTSWGPPPSETSALFPNPKFSFCWTITFPPNVHSSFTAPASAPSSGDKPGKRTASLHC